MLRPLIAAAVLAAAIVPAAAADLPTHKTPASPLSPIPAWNWTGPYAGLNGGVAWWNGSSNFYTLGGAFLDSDSGSSGGGEARLGGQIGYRYQMPSNLVLGLEGSVEAAPSGERSAAGVTLKRSGRITGSLDGQIGYAFGDLLPYAMAGVSLGKTDATLTAFGITDNITVTRTGFQLGAGLDYHVFGNWIVSAQYRADWSGRFRYTFQNAGFYIDRTERAQTVLFGVSYKF